MQGFHQKGLRKGMENHMDKQSSYIQAIRNIYPDFNIETVQLNQQGQFNDILLVNGETIFRFPKTQREAARLVTETGLLRSLQRHVALPIPDPLPARQSWFTAISAPATFSMMSRHTASAASSTSAHQAGETPPLISPPCSVPFPTANNFSTVLPPSILSPKLPS